MRVRKLLSNLVALVLAFGLLACGSSTEPKEKVAQSYQGVLVVENGPSFYTFAIAATRPNKFTQFSTSNIDVVSRANVYDLAPDDTIWIGYGTYGFMFSDNFSPWASDVLWSFAGNMQGGDTTKLAMGPFESLYEMQGFNSEGMFAGAVRSGIHPINNEGNDFLVKEKVENVHEMYGRQMLLMVWRPMMCGDASVHRFSSTGFNQLQQEVGSGDWVGTSYDAPKMTFTCNPAIEGEASLRAADEPRVTVADYAKKLRKSQYGW